MTTLESISQTRAIAKEIDNIMLQFSLSKNNSEIMSNGRTYKVANVIKNTQDNWIVTDAVSRGMFSCPICGSNDNPKLYIGDDWTQFVHGDDVIRMHCSLIHYFNLHPENVPQCTLEKAANIFLPKVMH